MTPDLEQATEYILLTLLKNGGTFNFLHLESKKFKNERQRFEAIDYLLSHHYIAKVQGSFKLVHRLTDKGKSFLYRNYFNKVLHYLSENDRSFKQVSDILKELSIPDTSDELANAIDTKLRRDNLVFATEESGVKINDNGRHLLAEQKFGLTEQNQATHITNSGVFIQGSQVNQSSFSDFAKNLPTQAANAPATRSDHAGTWLKRTFSNNWTITIVGGIIVGLIVAFIVFYLKWNH